MRIDQAHETLDRKGVLRDGAQQFSSNRIGFRLAARSLPLAGQYIAPPLQADFAGQRLADMIAHMGDFGIERRQREPAAPHIRRDEQACGIGPKILRAHEIGAERSRIAAHAAHGTAINAAATRRRSPSMML